MGAGIPVIFLKGAALAETAYPKPALQHAHHLDILVKSCDFDRALQILRLCKFTRSSVQIASEASVELIHESQLPLILHQRLFRIPFYHVPAEEVWGRSQIHLVGNAPTRLLSPADNLVHICGFLFEMQVHESLRWVCDAWFLIHRYPDLDWDVLLEYAQRSRIALPLYLTLDYLAGALSAPVPAGVLDRLCAAVSDAKSIEHETALHVIQTRGGLMGLIQNSGGWRTRALILKWALFPSPSYLRWVHDIPSSWVLPLYYIYRPLRYVANRLLSTVRVSIQRMLRQKTTAQLIG
jgi:hypothetical protein